MKTGVDGRAVEPDDRAGAGAEAEAEAASARTSMSMSKSMRCATRDAAGMAWPG